MNNNYNFDDEDISSSASADAPIEWIEDPPFLTRLVKRVIDIVGAAIGIVLAAPLLIVVAATIKLTSRGPVLFAQTRIGYHGQEFQFLKFRSMYLPSVYRANEAEYVKRLIAGEFGKMGESGVYKLRNDPRITRIGRFLRKTSLDELPQFFNVLQGSMSLVGPRPPVPYEWNVYEDWHKRRLSCKPGITGLWQVSGRSAVMFDDMVKLDLQYAQAQSAWLDLKILFRTPFVVLPGRGAY